jgi:lysozyme family protein
MASRIEEVQTRDQQTPAEKAHVGVKGLVVEDFYNPGMPSMDPAILIETARMHNIEPEALQAFALTESPKGAYMPDGRMPILYEAHVFARNTEPKNRFSEEYPTLSSSSWDRTLYGAGGGHQYDRLQRAMILDQRAALMACSWGAYQILGENYEMLGFSTVEDMILFMLESEANQFDCFMRFLTKRSIIPALRAKDWDTAFFKYNGPQFRTHGYDVRFLGYYRDLISHTLRKGAQGVKVTTLQKLLNKQGMTVTIDGIFGTATDDAVRKLQQRWGIVVDGVVGAQTYERLAAERVAETSMLESKRNIGGATAVVTGVAAAAKGVVDATNGTTAQIDKAESVLDSIKDLQGVSGGLREVVVSARDATEQVQKVNDSASGALLIFGFIVIAIGAYVIWTKWQDRKREQGVPKK